MVIDSNKTGVVKRFLCNLMNGFRHTGCDILALMQPFLSFKFDNDIYLALNVLLSEGKGSHNKSLAKPKIYFERYFENGFQEYCLKVVGSSKRKLLIFKDDIYLEYKKNHPDCEDMVISEKEFIMAIVEYRHKQLMKTDASEGSKLTILMPPEKVYKHVNLCEPYYFNLPNFFSHCEELIQNFYDGNICINYIDPNSESNNEIREREALNIRSTILCEYDPIMIVPCISNNGKESKAYFYERMYNGEKYTLVIVDPIGNKYQYYIYLQSPDFEDINKKKNTLCLMVKEILEMNRSSISNKNVSRKKFITPDSFRQTVESFLSMNPSSSTFLNTIESSDDISSFKMRDNILREYDDELIFVMHFKCDNPLINKDSDIYYTKENKDIYFSYPEFKEYEAYVYESEYKDKSGNILGKYTKVILEPLRCDKRRFMINLGQLDIKKFSDLELYKLILEKIRIVLNADNGKLPLWAYQTYSKQKNADAFRKNFELFIKCVDPTIIKGSVQGYRLLNKIALTHQYYNSRTVVVSDEQKRRICGINHRINGCADKDRVKLKKMMKRRSN